ncbi:MAG: extracellular solute-binding protein [Paracoccaceae bacterium]|nr:extracellular solute-binding protein [Paracoccaceae bacterium]
MLDRISDLTPKALGGAKTLAAGLAISLAATTASAQDITLRFGHLWDDASPDGKVIAAALDAFAAEFPDVEVVEEVLSHDEYLAQFKVSAASGALVDVFAVNRTDIPSAARAGLLRDLDGAMETNAQWGEALTDTLVAEGVVDGETYAIPAFQIVTHVIFYNSAMLEAAGYESFPDTWEGLLSLIDALNEKDVTPIALGNKAAWVAADPLFSTLANRATGSDWYDRLLANEAKFTDPEFVASLALFEQLSDVGAFNADANSLDNDQQKALFLNEEAAMFIEGNWAIQPIIDGASPELLDNVGMAIWPSVPGGAGAPNAVSGGSGWLWAANADLDGEAAAAAEGLIAALTGEVAGRARLENGLMPSSSLQSTDGIEVPAMLAELSNQVGSGELTLVPIFVLPLPGGVFDVLGKGLQDLMTDSVTPEALAEKLQEEYERAL